MFEELVQSKHDRNMPKSYLIIFDVMVAADTWCTPQPFPKQI
jgi:hypothetical protein